MLPTKSKLVKVSKLKKLPKNKIIRNCATVMSRALDVKPFESIPGPPGSGLPFIGHTNLFGKKPAGIGKSWENLKECRNQFLKEDDKLMRLNLPPFNPEGQGKFVLLLDPNDVEQIYRHEGKYPNRGNGFEAFKLMREARQDIFGETTGVLMEEREKWYDIRSKIQQDLMRPRSAHFYLEEIQEVADEFMDFIRSQRSSEKIIKDCLPEIYRFTFESISLIALDTRLGCLKVPMDPDIARTFQASKRLLESFLPLIQWPTWKFLPPRWNKTFRNAQADTDILLNFGKKKVDEATKRIFDDNIQDSHEMSVLQKLILRNGPNSSYPLVTAIDMIFAGIDTTGNTLGFLMYHLATNPDKQEKLQKECQSLGDCLSVKSLNELRYLKACIQESNRLTPTIALMVRLMPEEFNLHGYQIPKKTMMAWSPMLFQEQFKDWDKFIPERWIDNRIEKNICPHAVRQFSFGPRMCVGKRFADMELLIVMHKMMHNFDLKWVNEDPMTISQVLVNVPDQSLDFQFNDLK